MTDQKLNRNIVQNLADMYFQGIADDISNAKQISAIYPNNGDKGDVRENILLSFLKSHLPPRSIIAKGGCIFDSEGNASKQMDIFIASDSSLRFSYFDNEHGQNKNIQTIEGCLAAISVKSTLTKEELIDALVNLASIPLMPQDMLGHVSPYINQRENYLNFPFKVVFAFYRKHKKKNTGN